MMVGRRMVSVFFFAIFARYIRNVGAYFYSGVVEEPQIVLLAC